MRRRLEAARTQSPNIISLPMPVRSSSASISASCSPEADGEVLVAEVDQAGARPGGVAHGVDREHGGLGLPVVDRHALDVVEHRGAQVIDRHHVTHCDSFNLAR